MKNLFNLLLLATILSCGKSADDAWAPDNGLETKDLNNRRVQTLSGTSFEGFSYADIPQTILLAWYPDKNYYNTYKKDIAKLGYKSFMSFWKKAVFVTAKSANDIDLLGDVMVAKIDKLRPIQNTKCPELLVAEGEEGFEEQ